MTKLTKKQIIKKMEAGAELRMGIKPFIKEAIIPIGNRDTTKTTFVSENNVMTLLKQGKIEAKREGYRVWFELVK